MSLTFKQESEDEESEDEESEDEASDVEYDCSPPTYHNVLVSHSASAQDLPELTTVNGIGMWNQWTRNFKTPLLALLDLMDNAFDAACVESDFAGHVCVYTDNTPLGHVSGLVLKNNSPRYIKPMAQVLQVYQSAKGDLSESIGENGVGLKQGCATLSDLSFCISKNLRHYSLGILSRSLQREEGCSLPSFTFPNLPTFQELRDLFQTQPLVGECVKKYGGGSPTRGIERLLFHIQEMKDKHAFMVILHHLRHGSHSNNSVDYAQSASGLLQKLAGELPRQYIHVPSNVEVRLQDQHIAFCYWQHRLIELSVFSVEIDPKHAVAEAPDWKDPVNGYSLRIYAGFDPIRVNESSKSPVSLFVYSRQSGRLIKHSVDARSVLGLTSSGTQFCQGLTILVDDIHGKLPLNPTKQDLAFGEEANGEIHRSNLYAWLSAVTKLYYNFHLSKFEKKQKGLLTDQVKRHVRAFERVHFVKPLPECHLTTFADVQWFQKGGEIYGRKPYDHVHGEDTLVQIIAPTITKAPPSSGPSQKTATPRTTKEPARSSSLPVIEIGNLRKRKADDASSHAEPPETTRPLSPVSSRRAQIRLEKENTRLEQENSRLRRDKFQMKDALVTTLNQKKELEKQNADLNEALCRSQSRNTDLERQLKATLEERDGHEELALAKKEVEELQQALVAVQFNVQVARNETEIQLEIANDLRRKCAQLKRCVDSTSSPS